MSGIPKSEISLWDFEREAGDMERRKSLDQDSPSMLDTPKLREGKRLYDDLRNAVRTNL